MNFSLFKGFSIHINTQKFLKEGKFFFGLFIIKRISSQDDDDAALNIAAVVDDSR